MKVTINIDCTPEEARGFFGLPDVKPMQDAMMAEMQRRMQEGLTAQDMETLMKAWTNPALSQGMTDSMTKGMEQFQKMFWSAFGGQDAGQGAGQGAGDAKKPSSKK